MASALESWLTPSYRLLNTTPHGQLLMTTLGVGLIEEACKFLPLALFIYKKRYFNEHTDGLIYFALAGLGFGLPENILYTLQFGARAGATRLFLTPLFHAASTGAIGYFLIKRKLARQSALGIGVPLVMVAALHGLYDFGLLSGSNNYQAGALTITLGMSLGLFMLFLKATEKDQDMGISAFGHNNFCRSCGWPNPQHHLYCTHCGQHA
jgi:RsiW-degrading membrane proteinase PrsW (M82 family)